MEKFYCIYRSPSGDINIVYDSNGVIAVLLPYESLDNSKLIFRNEPEIESYFNEYFTGGSPVSPRLNIKITDFQKKVFDILLTSKRGTIMTYKDLGRLIGCQSPRAVGQALKHNPVPIIIPCHRVVGSGWKGGFAGETTGVKMEFKQFLIDLEK